MVFKRSGECSVNPHPNCSGCGTAVRRQEFHDHAFNRDGGRIDTLCGSCATLVARAAQYVLTALRDAGCQPRDAQRLDWLAREGVFQILTQRQMSL